MRNLALIFSIFLVACEKNESTQVAPQPTKMTYEQALKSDDFKKLLAISVVNSLKKIAPKWVQLMPK